MSMSSGKKPQAQKQGPIGALNVQTSVLGAPWALIYGKTRVPVNLLHFKNFKATAHNDPQKSGGKGGGGKPAANVSYTYSAAVAMAIGVGQVAGVGQVWKDQEKTTLAAAGLTLFSGAIGQTPWSYLTTYFPAEAVPYSGLAYIASASLDFGSSASMANWNVEAKGLLPYSAGTIDDAEPSAIITDYLTDAYHGAGFGAYLGSLTLFQTYCRARGLFISPSEDNQRNAGGFVEDIANLCNSAVVWANGQLTLIPYGDTTITGNGATYTPDLIPKYDLTEDDFQAIAGQPLVRQRSKPSSTAFNHVRLEYLDRGYDYNPVPVEVKDQASIDDIGLRSREVIQAHAITSADVARDVAQLQMQRDLYVNDTFEFTLPVRFSLLDLCDLVTLTEPSLGLDRQLVRIISVSEKDDELEFVAEEMNVGTAHAPAYQTGTPSGYNADYAVTPGAIAAPIIMNAPGLLTATGYEMWIGAAGTGAFWGGCSVWVSVDNVNYKHVGEMLAPSRYGTLQAVYASGAAYDTTNTLDVNLVRGAILSASQADCDNWRALCFVDGEWVSFRDSTLVSGTRFQLKPNQRGGYGSTIASHASGSVFARIDESIFKLPYDKGMVGQTMYFKFPSFNVYGAGAEDIAGCPVYSHVVGASSAVAPLYIDDISDSLTGSGNLIGNADFSDGSNGFTALGGGVTVTLVFYAGGSYAYAPPGVNILGLWNGGGVALSGAQYIECRVSDLPVEPGKSYIASAYLGAHRCDARIYIRWYDSTGTFISSSVGSPATTASGGASLADYARNATINSLAPAGAATAQVWIRGAANASTGIQSYLFVARPMFEEVTAAQTKPSPWSLSAMGITAKALLAIANAASAQATADGKIDSFYQTSPPTIGSGPSDAKLGDIWFDTDDGNKIYTVVSGSWVATPDSRIAQAINDAAGAQSTADGKVKTFFQSTPTPTASGVGDLWFNTVTRVLTRWNGTSWAEAGSTPAPSQFTNGVMNDKSYGNNLITNPSFADNIGGYAVDVDRPAGSMLFDGWIALVNDVTRGTLFGETDQADGPNLFMQWKSGTAISNGAGYTMLASAMSNNFIQIVSGKSYFMRRRLRVLRNITPPAGVDWIARTYVKWFDYLKNEISPVTYWDWVTISAYDDAGKVYAAPGNACYAKVIFTLFARNTTGSTYTPAGLVCDMRVYNCGLHQVSDLDNDVLDGTNYGRLSNNDLYPSGGFNRLGLRIGGSGHRIGSQRNNVRSGTSAYGMVRSTTALSATSAGAISVNAHSVRYGSFSISYSAVTNAVTGLTQSTTYCVYCTDPDLTGGTKTYSVAANPDAAMQISDDIYIVGQIMIPTSGSSSGGGGGGGGDPGDWCVDADSFLPDGTRAGDLAEGAALPCYNNLPDAPGIVDLPVQRNAIGESECLRMTTESGASIVASVTTPMTLRDGSLVMLPEMLGRQAIVYRPDGSFLWEIVVELQPGGVRRVAKISVRDQCYFAGETQAAFIATHNIGQIKP